MYRTVHAIIQTERIEERDLVAMGMLQSLGIERGKPFESSAEMVPMFNAAAKETQDHMRQTYLFGNAIYYPGTQWRTTFRPGMYETRYTWLYPALTDFDNRGYPTTDYEDGVAHGGGRPTGCPAGSRQAGIRSPHHREYGAADEQGCGRSSARGVDPVVAIAARMGERRSSGPAG
jgi:hypothetical protein